jgi:protein SOK2
MNQSHPYMDNHGPGGAPPQGIPYSSYGQPQALQPAAQPYQPNGYAPYPYAASMAPMTPNHQVTSAQMVGQPQSLPALALGPGAPQNGSGPQYQPQQSFDMSGQIAPHGMKPRVTATLWEDEGSLCFQVEANGVCVARREDNHMINGTKLLNVAGMTRGRRDGILKSEKTRHVVKIGPMHLKGVW